MGSFSYKRQSLNGSPRLAQTLQNKGIHLPSAPPIPKARLLRSITVGEKSVQDDKEDANVAVTVTADKVKDVEDEKNSKLLRKYWENFKLLEKKKKKRGKEKKRRKGKKQLEEKLKRCRRGHKKSFRKGQLNVISQLIKQLKVIEKELHSIDAASNFG